MQGDRLDQVRDDREPTHDQEERRHHVGERQRLRRVDRAGIGQSSHLGPGALDPLPQGADHMAAVEREKRDQVEQAEEQIQAREQAEDERRLVEHRGVLESDSVAGDSADAHDTDDAVGVAGLGREGLASEVVEADRQRDDGGHGVGRLIPHDPGHGGDRLGLSRESGNEAEEVAHLVLPGGLAVGVVDRTLHRLDGDRERHIVSVARDHHRHVTLGRGLDGVLHLGPLGDGLTVEGDDHIAGLDARGGSRRRGGVDARTLGRRAVDVARGGHTGAHLRDGGGRTRQADDRHHDGEHHEGEEEIHARATEHDEHPLADGQLVEDSVDVLGTDLLERLLAGVVDERGEATGRGRAQLGRVGTLLGRVHPDHPDVAAERHRLDAVLGLALEARPDGRAEADHVLRDLDAERLRGQQVTDLVHADAEADADQEDQPAEHFKHQGHADPPVRSCARDRAHLSQERTSSTLVGFPWPLSRCSSTTTATVSTIAR